MLIADDLGQLLEILPDFIRYPLQIHSQRKVLIEVVMDLGRKPEARFPKGPEYLSSKIITWQDLDYSIKRTGNFSGDNRAGIERTLHRISSIKNRQGNIVGLTCRVGRAVLGTISIIRDLLDTNPSILLLGKPGVGKTTAIREIARVLADEMEKRVVIIDTSNEIAGDGDIPHPAIGRARRMQVSRPELQHQVMIEAVENHMPEVIIIDEIGTELEALAARTIAERGVQLVGTAHGNYLDSLIKNPVLSDLIGGIQYVTLGDDEAKRRGSQKSILERKASPAFQVAIEIHDRNSWIVHESVGQAVDQLLQGVNLWVQRRKLMSNGSISIECEEYLPTTFVSNTGRYHSKMNIKNLRSSSFTTNLVNIKLSPDYPQEQNSEKLQKASYKSSFCRSSIEDVCSIRVYLYYINNAQVQMIINSLYLPIIITRDIVKADVILSLRSNFKHNTKLKQVAKTRQISIYTICSSTSTSIKRALVKMVNTNKVSNYDWNLALQDSTPIELKTLIETRMAIEKIVNGKQQSVELLPRDVNLRKLQHKLINFYNLRSRSFGEEPNRRLKIYPK
uniref:R3H domain-containing protein n=1 Tax=Gracilaria vermiculophylla TaxID=2608709 RepID=A0A345U921_9FLOR|nr:hypothetical protein [Gracilaria vermiculophylla]AXI96957.1 hypothetical protein [Gracilaria vermiculophylla]QXU75162.1 hypothetical protein [Gracilaria vermiculophylla]WDZ67890.1 hypothetical protein [Gracilaria vermiculophylla]